MLYIYISYRLFVHLKVSVGANWKTVLGHIKIFHVNYRQNQLKNTVVGIALGIFAVLILGLIFVKRRYHLGGFRKKISVIYLNNQEDRNMIGPQNETGNKIYSYNKLFCKVQITLILVGGLACYKPVSFVW